MHASLSKRDVLREMVSWKGTTAAKNCLLEASGHFAADYTQAIQLCLETLGAVPGEKRGGIDLNGRLNLS